MEPDELGEPIWRGIAVAILIISILGAATYITTGCGGAPPVDLGEVGGRAEINHDVRDDGEDLTSIDATAWWDICLTIGASGCERVQVGVLYVEGKPQFGHDDYLSVCVSLPHLGTFCVDPRDVGGE